MASKVSWRFSEFKHQMQSTDIDDWINALKNFNEYLQSSTDFTDIENNEQIFNIVIECLDLDTHVISEPIKMHQCLQTLLLLSTRISVSSLKNFLDKILKRALENQNDALLSNYSLLINDISSAFVNCNHDRQDSYINIVLKKCLEKINPSAHSDQKITTPLTILTTLIEKLGTFITNQQFLDLYEKIIVLIEDKSSSYINELASLTKIWSTYVYPDLLEQFLKKLIKYVDDNLDKAFHILTALVTYYPFPFAPYINKLADLFFQNIDLLTQKYNEGMDVSSQELQNTELSINALNALVNAFPNQFKPTIDVYCQVAFELFTYGVDSPVFTRSSEIQEISDSEFEANEEDLEINEEMDDEDPYIDNSYPIRKVINLFAQTLIKYYPDIFVQTFLENEQYQTNTLNLVVDPDSGSKSISLNTLLLFAQSCKGKIPELIVKNYIHAFINEIGTPEQKDLALLYSSFAQYLLEFPSFVSKYSLKIIQSVKKTQGFYQQTKTLQKQQGTLPNMLELFNVLISESTNIDEISPLICEILAPLINMKAQTNYQALFYTSSNLFSKSTSKSIKNLKILNKNISEIAKSDNLSAIYAIDPLSIYISLFSSLDKEGALKSLQIIISTASRSAAYTKNALSAISLVASSPSKKFLTQVTKELLSIIKKNISGPLTDASLLSKTLCTIYSCVQGENLFSSKQCEDIIPSIVTLFSFNDNRVRRLVVIVLKKLSTIEKVATCLIPELKGLLNSNDIIQPNIIDGVAEILDSAKDPALDKIIGSLIEDGKTLALKAGSELNCSNIALFIGHIISSRKALREKVLNEFTKEIENKDIKKINPFAVRCIGEIGFRFSLKENKSIINRIFELVLCNDRLIFSAAIHSSGLIAANSDAIQSMLPQIIERMKKDEQHLSLWLNVLAKCLKRRQRTSTNAKLDLSNLLGYLVSQKEYTQEQETTYAEIFSSILALNPPLVSSYFSKITEKNKASPMLTLAIADYIENSLHTAEEVKPLLTKMLPYLDPNNPTVCTGAISSVNNSIKYNKLLPLLVKSFSPICKCAEINDKQYCEIFYGATLQKVDLGRIMRIIALDSISSLFSITSEKLDINQMIVSVTKATKDPIKEIRSKALSLIIKALDNHITLRPILEHFVPTISENIEKPALDDIYESYIQIIAKLRVLTKNSKVLAVEKIAARVSNKELLQKYEKDFSQEFQQLNHSNTKYSNFNSKLICHQLMSKFNKEVAEIYVS